MKKSIFLIFLLSIFFLCSCNATKLQNSMKKKGNNIIYISASGNKYNYRRALMINKGYAYQSNHYYSSNDDDINTLVKRIPTNNYQEKNEEAFNKELFDEDMKNVFVFELNYGNNDQEFLESVTYHISPTKILLSIKDSKNQYYYIYTSDETFYNDFYQLEYDKIYGKTDTLNVNKPE